MAAADSIDLHMSPVVQTDCLNSTHLLMDADHEDSPKSPAAESNGLDCPNLAAKEDHHANFPEIRATQKDCSDSRKSLTAKIGCSASSMPSATMMDHRDFSNPSAMEPDGLGSPKLSCAEVDCPICFCRYSINRAPKLLVCQHTFCAVCLKLLLRNEDSTWLITCPLCRISTVVFGGLICSLHTRDELMDNTSSDAGLQLSPQEVVCPAAFTNSRRPDLDDNERTITVTTRRLVVLLLILAILVIIVLQFMYAGLLKWVLCFTMAVLIIMSVVLCSRISLRSVLRSTDTQKDSQIVSAA